MPDLPIIPGVQSVVIVDHEGNPVDFTHDGRMIVIDTEHKHLHDGNHFLCADVDSDVDIAGPKYWHVKNAQSAKIIHLIAVISASLSGLLEIFEGPTSSGDGAALTAFNSKRNSAVTAAVQCFKDPTTSADGTRIFVQVMGSDANGR